MYFNNIIESTSNSQKFEGPDAGQKEKKMVIDYLLETDKPNCGTLHHICTSSKSMSGEKCTRFDFLP